VCGGVAAYICSYIPCFVFIPTTAVMSITPSTHTQVLSKLYSLLGDEEKRAIYDEDGTVDEEDSSIFNQVCVSLSSVPLIFLHAEG